MLMEVRNVTKRFGGLAALSGVSFDLEEGQILGIIGPNGAGKTTLFNTICGISSATEGEILYQGEHIEKLSPHEVAQKGIARAFQVVTGKCDGRRVLQDQPSLRGRTTGHGCLEKGLSGHAG